MSDRGKRRRPVRPPSRLADAADEAALATSSSSSEEEGGGGDRCQRPRAATGAKKKLAAAGEHMYVYRFLTTRDITSDLAGETVFVLWPEDGTWYAAVVAKVRREAGH